MTSASAGGIAEERRVEEVDALQDPPRAHVARLSARGSLVGPRGVELGFGEAGDRLDARHEVSPQLAHVAGAGEAPGQPHDRDAFVRVVSVRVGHVQRLPTTLRAWARASFCRRARPFTSVIVSSPPER